jgi:hypothetical protein
MSTWRFDSVPLSRPIRACQLIVGGVLLFAAFAKAWHIPFFAVTVEYCLPMLPAGTGWPLSIAGTVIVVEGMSGLFLVMNAATFQVARLAFVALLLLSGFLVRLLLDPYAPACRCTGAMDFAERLADNLPASMTRNAVMVAMLGLIWRRSRPSALPEGGEDA